MEAIGGGEGKHSRTTCLGTPLGTSPGRRAPGAKAVKPASGQNEVISGSLILLGSLGLEEGPQAGNEKLRLH